jgi:aspartyl-tRNA(Asn)/glutamyl-tRNA(Gln) amidotransferase subunit A
MSTLHELTVAQAGRRIADGTLTPSALVEAVLDRIDQVDGIVSSMITVTADQARQQAAAADREIAASGPRGPLHGIPYALKDNIFTAGVRTTANSHVLAQHVPGISATVHERLQASGAILVGKLATWEYGTGTGADAAALPFPPCRNPWNPAHFSGGSSTGAGAAVAAGTALFTIGADTGGSIRLPAAACGVFGLKPTYGLVSRAGVLPNAWSLDHIGPLARTAQDLAIILDQITGHDDRDPFSAQTLPGDYQMDLEQGRDLRGVRVGVTHDLDDPDADPDIQRGFAQAIETLTALGAQIVPISLPTGQEAFINCQRLINMSECFSVHREDWLAQRHLMGPALADKLAAGACLPASAYLRAQRWRRMLGDAFNEVWLQCDVLLSAGVATPAPPMADGPKVADFVSRSAMAPYSLLGNPAISMPAGFSASGLPLSVQLAAKHFADATLLQVAGAYDRATGWSKHRPTITVPPMLPPQELPAPHPPVDGDRATVARDAARRAGLIDPTPEDLARFAAQLARTETMMAHLPKDLPRAVMPAAPQLYPDRRHR